MEQKTILQYETVALDDENDALVILDQTLLPNEVWLLHLTTPKEILKPSMLRRYAARPQSA